MRTVRPTASSYPAYAPTPTPASIAAPRVVALSESGTTKVCPSTSAFSCVHTRLLAEPPIARSSPTCAPQRSATSMLCLTE